MEIKMRQINLNLYNKILDSSIELQGELKKNGKGYKHKYFKTEDIIPRVLIQCQKRKIGYIPVFTHEEAGLIFFDRETQHNKKTVDMSETIIYTLPINTHEDQNPEKTIQLTGKMQTYYIRYLLIQVFSICEADELEIYNPDKIVEKKPIINREPKTSNLPSEELDGIYNKILDSCRFGGHVCVESKIYAYYDSNVINKHDCELLLKRWENDNQQN